MENYFEKGFLFFGIVLFYFSIMVLWSNSLSKRVSKKNTKNKNNEENAVIGFLHLEVILFLILGGFLFMNHRNE